MTLFDIDSRPRDPSVRRLKLVIAYAGTDFRGFAVQPDVRTVQGVLSDALAMVLNVSVEELRFSCAGRTDAGVHAWGQVVAIDAPADIDLIRIARSVNRLLGPEVVVRFVDEVAPEFDARHSAQRRTYRYTILNRPTPDPFLAAHSWWIAEPLNKNMLSLASDPFVGEHDFSAFCRQGPEGSSNLRKVEVSRWIPDFRDDVLVYEIQANAFCWQMVRSLVGTIVACGTGRLRPGEVMGIMHSKSRLRANQIAPPEGLCLWAVEY
ncbi:MAG: tRNA pseudouridine(38-40) synthase TruA [Actinobacteria bacterium]|nr:tRNA pseudouridine(38-40) synthase TruA [Acidimicrobiia bacterium]PHX60159.1 MAG: tRNA pseudouridine(38-40) synthase TruA [Actinomycetota bacterium]